MRSFAVLPIATNSDMALKWTLPFSVSQFKTILLFGRILNCATDKAPLNKEWNIIYFGSE
jgi:hypothetical protein